MPTFVKDTTDRNRTSPFAFTGNKFEFRMVGSETNLSDPNTVLNTIIAKTLADFAEALEGSTNFEHDAKAYMRKTLIAHRRIIFNGDNYSQEWPVEAEKRGLLNLRSTPDALAQFITPEAIALFERFGVLSKLEVESRHEVKLEHYSKKINIESLVTARMARARFMPAIIEYSSVIASSITAKKQVSSSIDTTGEEALLDALTKGINTISVAVDALEASVAKATDIEDPKENARAFQAQVLPAMNAVRDAVDEMELLVGHDYWPVPSYNHILFYC
jgi:glutamine synthetase